jgi:hypothetical protein
MYRDNPNVDRSKVKTIKTIGEKHMCISHRIRIGETLSNPSSRKKPQRSVSTDKTGCISKLVSHVPNIRTTCPDGWRNGSEDPGTDR